MTKAYHHEISENCWKGAPRVVRKAMGLDGELNPHQQRAARERREAKIAFRYCPTCRRYSWMAKENNKWVCRECGCPEEVRNG